MNSKAIAVLCLFLAVSFATAKMDEFGNEMQEDFNSPNDEFAETETAAKVSDEKPAETKKTVVEDLGSETSALVQQDSGDSDADKHKGFCHWGVAVWFKPGFNVRCGCLRCTCATGGVWKCAYFFAYCPYYYCGNVIYNPHTQICCCGKVHAKKSKWACCGYFYYNTAASKCCNYYSVKPRNANCPRFRV